MAPLKSRINNTLHKLNDKLMKRHWFGDDNDAAQAKQPRTIPPDALVLKPSGQSSSQQNHFIGAPTPPGDFSSPTPRTSGSANSAGSTSSSTHEPAYSYAVSLPSPDSAMAVDYLHHQTPPMQPSAPAATLGTLTNPIDLTANSDSPTVAPQPVRIETIDLTGDAPIFPPSGLVANHQSGDPMVLDDDPRSIEFKNGDSTFEDIMWGDCSDNWGRHDDAEYARRLQDSENQTSHFYLEDEKLARLLHNQLNPGQPTTPITSSFAANSQTGSMPSFPAISYHDESGLVHFGQKLLETVCIKCRTPMIGDGEEIVERTSKILAYDGTLHPWLECKKCKTLACMGCGPEKNCIDINTLPKFTGEGCTVAWCCDVGRLFLIWSLGCGLEFKKPDGPGNGAGIGRLLFKEKSKVPSKTDTAVAHNKPAIPTPKAWSKGIGYGGDEGYGNTTSFNWTTLTSTHGSTTTTTGSADASNARRAEDKLFPLYFRALSLLLPCFSRVELAFDTDPPPLVQFILRRSPLFQKVAELLRNDSIDEIWAQENLYTAVLDFVETVGSHTCTSTLLYTDQTIFPAEEQLICFSLQNGQPSAVATNAASALVPRSKGKQPEKGQAIVDIIANMAKHCRNFNQAASAHLEDFETEQDQQMLLLSRRICDIAALQEQCRLLMGHHSAVADSSNARRPTSFVLTRSREAEKAREDLREWHKNNCVAEVLDEEILPSFYFKAQAAALNASTVAKGRMKKLASQIAILQTSLPEGIWVRHCSSRLDVLKVLMVGPKGTPYENGLFEFDLFCPGTYPQAPPMMNFRTNGGGRVRFNPNLYEDGKVCLSLLGTWSGEPWNPAFSTLLQVLVSIHGMILIDEPWYNEPGRERSTNKSESEKYNSQVQQLTLQYAMLNWLNERLAPPGSPSSSPSMNNQLGPPPSPVPLAGSGVHSGYAGHGSGHNPAPTTATATATATSSTSNNALKDDLVWGEIIRKHFAANAKSIMEAAKKWKGIKRNNSTQGKLVLELQEALTKHGFL